MDRRGGETNKPVKQKKSRGKVHAQRKVPADIRGHVRVPNVSPLSPTSRGQVAFENAKRKKAISWKGARAR